MTILEIKQIPISSYLATLSILPAKETRTSDWYLSPLHEEATPSFKVDLEKNLWYDHGCGKGGTNIDLVMLLSKTDFNGACGILGGNEDSFSFSPKFEKAAGSTKKESESESESEFEIVAVRELKNPALIKYLESRQIDIAIAKKFSNEIFFKKKNVDKNLFAISFKNDLGGYETRNAIFKGNIGGKSITTIKGKGTGRVAVFEGFMDFLSILTKYKMQEITDDVIVLNSLSMISSVKSLLEGYSEVKYFLDNDKPGIAATAALIDSVGGTDKSYLYKNYKDANDWIMDKKINN